VKQMVTSMDPTFSFDTDPNQCTVKDSMFEDRLGIGFVLNNLHPEMFKSATYNHWPIWQANTDGKEVIHSPQLNAQQHTSQLAAIRDQRPRVKLKCGTVLFKQSGLYISVATNNSFTHYRYISNMCYNTIHYNVSQGIKKSEPSHSISISQATII
jgi:hypothetical protein